VISYPIGLLNSGSSAFAEDDGEGDTEDDDGGDVEDDGEGDTEDDGEGDMEDNDEGDTECDNGGTQRITMLQKNFTKFIILGDGKGT